MKNEFDVVVVGGGFSGVCAAIAAARENKNVLLIDENYQLGGAASNSLINPFMKYYVYDKETEKPCQLNKGLFSEILKGLSKLEGLNYTDLLNIIFNNEYLKIVSEQMCVKYHVNLLFGTRLISVDKEKNVIKSIKIHNKDGIKDLFAKVFIDCSGDGNLFAEAKLSYQLGREKDNLTQPMTLCFDLANVDIEEYRKEKPLINPLYKKFQEEGKILNKRENVLIFNSTTPNVLHFNTTRVLGLSPIDATDFTKAQIEGRKQLLEIFLFLKNNFKAFKNATIINSGAVIGVRESRMLIGEYVLNEEDIKNYTKFDDGIACSCYDIDIHSPDGTGTYIFYLDRHDYYTIPYRCLVTKECDNLIVAGRCISTTHAAQASYRIMPVVANIGEAAGIAASIAIDTNKPTHKIDVSNVQSIIEKNGGKCF